MIHERYHVGRLCSGSQKVAAKSAQLAHSQLTQALLSGICSEPFPEHERCSLGWISVAHCHATNPTTLPTDIEADVCPRKSLQAAVTMGGGLQKRHWLSGWGLHAAGSGVIVCHEHRGCRKPQGSSWASGGVEASGVAGTSAPFRPSGLGWTSSSSRQPDIPTRETRLCGAAVQACPASLVGEKGHYWIHATVQPSQILSHAQCFSVSLPITMCQTLKNI